MARVAFYRPVWSLNCLDFLSCLAVAVARQKIFFSNLYVSQVIGLEEGVVLRRYTELALQHGYFPLSPLLRPLCPLSRLLSCSLSSRVFTFLAAVMNMVPRICDCSFVALGSIRF